MGCKSTVEILEINFNHFKGFNFIQFSSNTLTKCDSVTGTVRGALWVYSVLLCSLFNCECWPVEEDQEVRFS